MTNSAEVRIRAFEFARRMLAWGVLGLATGGVLVSLLTLMFSGGLIVETQLRLRSFGFICDFQQLF